MSDRTAIVGFNAGWMLAALLFTCAWWIGLWDLHTVRTWDVGSIALYFSIAAGIYLQARLVSPRIPERGEIDLREWLYDSRVVAQAIEELRPVGLSVDRLELVALDDGWRSRKQLIGDDIRGFTY